MRSALALALVAACVPRPAQDRAEAEQSAGPVTADGVTITVEDGLAAVRSTFNGTLRLWAQAPVLHIDLQLAPDAPTDWILQVDNALPDAQLTGAPADELQSLPRTSRRWRLSLPPGTTSLTVAPPDADDPTPFEVAAMGDIQTAMPHVDELFRFIDTFPSVRFVVFLGDVTQWGSAREYDEFEQKLLTLDVPIYSTIGNHELFGDTDQWLARYGRFDVHFTFHGVAFSLVDSASATVDPIVRDELDGWLGDAIDRVHIFATHIPPRAPNNIRGESSFASQREAADLLDRLAEGRVDLTLYGHVHSYARFENAGIPAYISGGGGAAPVALDGIGRHFLTVDVDPAAQAITDVCVHPLDDPSGTSECTRPGSR